MKSERKKHFAVDKLSAQSRRIVDDSLEQNLTYDTIVKAVKAAGESLNLSSLARYRAGKWFPIKQTLEETNHFYGLIKESLEKTQGKKLDEVSSELLKTHLFKALAALKEGDPVKLYDLVISEGRLNVEKEKIGISKEKLKLEEQKVRALEKEVELKEKQFERARVKAVAADKRVEEIGKKKGLDPETMRTIKEQLYGIVDAGS